jgi:hypothetical protein
MKRSASNTAKVLLVLALLASPASAAGFGTSLSWDGDVTRVFSAFWRTITEIVPVFEKGHGTIDPNGEPTDSSSTDTDTSDTGDGHGTIDPNG